MYEKHDALNITPDRTPPVAAFVPILRSGNLLFSSSHVASGLGELVSGKLA